jgi:L-alanine-DL-glutamate epimerase-like enolase superfamily enzyme
VEQNKTIGSFIPIKNIKVSAFKIPTDYPESDGTFIWDSTTMILVEIDAGSKTGIGYTYTSEAAAQIIKNTFADILLNKNSLDIDLCWQEMIKAVRNMGSRGIAANAVSAVDNALWDLKAKLFNIPLVTLLGQVRNGCEIYGSGGFTSYEINKLQQQLGNWAMEGIKKVKMKIGRNPADDPDRVKAAREAIGNDCLLYVDANGAYTVRQAISQAEKFADYKISWFEEPVSSDDLQGLNFIRNNLPPNIEVAAGEYGYNIFYFRRMLEEQAVDVLQADATRCLGISGFLRTAHLCESFNLPLSAHTAPLIHLHPCCSSSIVRDIEYFHDHVRIEKMFFEGFPAQQKGLMIPDLSAPGIGVEIRRQDIKKYEV